MLDPLVKRIEVPCSQEKAFGIFTNEMGSANVRSWPLAAGQFADNGDV
jgi:hypothetical protein